MSSSTKKSSIKFKIKNTRSKYNFPNVFNSQENKVVDIYGNMEIVGDTYINGNENVTNNCTAKNVICNDTLFSDKIECKTNSLQMYIGAVGKSVNVVGQTLNVQSSQNNIFSKKTIVENDILVKGNLEASQIKCQFIIDVDVSSQEFATLLQELHNCTTEENVI